MTKPVRAAFSRYGGKHDMLPVILPLIPRHESWLELFAGAAWVTLAKQASEIETINDLHDGIVGFYRVVREPEQFTRLCTLLEQTPYARVEKTAAVRAWKTSDDPIERARAWFVAARMCCNASPHAGGWSAARSGRQIAVSKWLTAIEGLPAVHERLRMVQVEHKDWRALLPLHNYKRCMLYADPPYVLSTRSGCDRYEHELTNDDHRDLVDALLQWKGPAMVSGYAHPIYETLERAGWYRIDTNVHCNATANRPTTRTNQRVETLWLNYDPAVVTGQRTLF